jgi:hypothetical protein
VSVSNCAWVMHLTFYWLLGIGYWHSRSSVLVASPSLSLAGRVANGSQDILDIMLDMGELHHHLLHT